MNDIKKINKNNDAVEEVLTPGAEDNQPTSPTVNAVDSDLNNLSEEEEVMVPRKDLHEESDRPSLTWLWWLIAILALLGIVWFFITSSRGNGVQVNELVDSSASLSERYGDGEYDENGLPLQGPLAAIDTVELLTSESFPVGQSLRVSGTLESTCTYLNDPVQLTSGNTVYVNLTTRVEENGDCTDEPQPYDRTIELDVLGLGAGDYVASIHGQEIPFSFDIDNYIEDPIEAGLNINK